MNMHTDAKIQHLVFPFEMFYFGIDEIEGDRKCFILAFLHQFGHVIVTDVKIQHFKGKN